jgi:hypothetical protein
MKKPSNVRKAIAILTLPVLMIGQACTKKDTATLSSSDITLMATAATTNPSPYTVLNLDTFWKLSVPIDSNGSNTGPATTISRTKLAAGYSSNYFTTMDSPYTNIVRLWCPVNGATTTPGSGSDHPRTELIENTPWYTKNQAAISKETIGGRLDVVMAIKQFSSTNDIIIGQIHGGGKVASSYPFVMVHINNDSLVAWVKGDTTTNNNTKHYTLLRNVKLGTKIAFSITDSTNNKIYFRASASGASGTGAWNIAVPIPWAAVQVRFQTGNYLQDHDLSAASSPGSKINLYSVKITH